MESNGLSLSTSEKLATLAQRLNFSVPEKRGTMRKGGSYVTSNNSPG